MRPGWVLSGPTLAPACWLSPAVPRPSQRWAMSDCHFSLHGACGQEIQRYMHLTVRLFSILHACFASSKDSKLHLSKVRSIFLRASRTLKVKLRMAMEEIAELKHENFRVIDALGLDKASRTHSVVMSSRPVTRASVLQTTRAIQGLSGKPFS